MLETYLRHDLEGDKPVKKEYNDPQERGASATRGQCRARSGGRPAREDKKSAAKAVGAVLDLAGALQM